MRPGLGLLVKLAAALGASLLIFVSAGAASQHSQAAQAAKIVFVDVDQGDGVAMRIGGKIIVSDAGWPHKADEMHARLELLGANKHIDLAILSHPHLDHVGGFKRLVEQFGYDIDKAIRSSNGEWLKPNKKPVLDALADSGTDVEELDKGDSISLGGASWKVLSPPPGMYPAASSVENGSLVVLLQVNGRRVLFTGDIKEAATAQLAATWGNLGRAHILLVTHHGSKAGSSADLLKELQPRFAVISAGAENTFGHPSPETVERLRATAAKTERIYCTITNGTVTATISASGAISWTTTPGKQAAPWWSRSGGQAGVCKGKK